MEEILIEKVKEHEVIYNVESPDYRDQCTRQAAWEEIGKDLKIPDNDDLTPEASAAKELELEGVKSAESGNIDKAIEKFEQAISLAPNRASGYNNRAQAHRLKGEISAALDDLNAAIQLSASKGRTACLAYCQRALIYRFQNKSDQALEDFKKAATLGSSFARSQIIQMNPYAALCNQMLAKVMAQYQNGSIEHEKLNHNF